MLTKLGCYLLNSLGCLLYKKDYRDFMNIKDVRQLQAKKLQAILQANQDSSYGRRYDFAAIRDIGDFQARLPLTVYEDYLPYVQRIMAGETGVLTGEAVLLLEPSSGSASPSKLIPYTAGLKHDFQMGIRPWLYDLYSGRPHLKWGKSYWSVTPAVSRQQFTEGGIPVGFEDDKAYFGGFEKSLLDMVMAVPSAAGQAETMADFYHETALGLLKCRELTLISVWNPSFLRLILEYMTENCEVLAGEIQAADQARAEAIRHHLPREEYVKLWENLRLISCWADGNARVSADSLMELFPGVELQPKGLLATEGFVSFPLTESGGSVLSVASHFFEFLSESDGEVYLADQLEIGGRYRVILTTSGGFYRYDLKDLIQVTDFYREVPVIRFLGKADKVSDRFGEKLNEVFVQDALAGLGISEGFHMLAPEGDRYVLYIAAAHRGAVDGGMIDEALCANFHYDYCRRLGQLKAVRVFQLTGDPGREFLEESVQRGQRLGNIKPAVLNLQGGWDKVFKGEYL